MQTKRKNVIKKVTDVLMTVLLLCLMAYQVTGETLHEFCGIAMTVLLIVHHILNFRWYKSLFKGKYNAYRVVTVAVNTLLLASISLTALCGMAMSSHAVPFLYGMLPVSFARRFHLAMSFWSFILMGLHLGLHIPAMTAGFKWNGRIKTAVAAIFAVVSGIGFWLFVKNGIPDYIFFRTPFAFFDYEKAAALVFLENLAILTAFAFLGASIASLIKAARTENGANPGIRLVRSAVPLAQTVTAAEGFKTAAKGGKTLIVFFSWSGNTRGVAREIQKQTGADVFEITLVHPYSSNYNTVLMETQEDQHRQARPEIKDSPANIEGYDTILLGYPNWWASIPMPIATFLESYDFSGKTIIPFCSHGGGRFGQSLTAIAKLAPDAVIGEGLSIHYSGGSSLSDDVSAWLDTNGIKRK
jgi:flavodoxin